MSLAAGALIASRFLHYLALSVLFGAGLFPYYGIAAPHRKRRMPVWLPMLLRASALLALASGLSWFLFVAAGMSGALSGAVDPAVLSLVLGQTGFGRVWIWRLALAALLVLLLLGRNVQAWRYSAVLVGSLVLIASLALTGHAGADMSPAGLRHRVVDALHLVAAGVWVGALLVLAGLARAAAERKRPEDVQILHHAMTRFSYIGPAVVGPLVLSGILNPGFLSGFSTVYGQVLLAKLALFLGMLGLAAAHRYRLGPRLARALVTGDREADAVRVLQKTLFAETVLMLLVLAAVAWLGTLSPEGG
jgi:copper resistance protein D